MAVHLTEHRGGFGPGLTEITRLDERDDPAGIALGVLRLSTGDHVLEAATETAWLVMHGAGSFSAGGQTMPFSRCSLFDERPSVAHLGAGERLTVHAEGELELTTYRTQNPRPFAPRLHPSSGVRDEERGKGQVGGACLRLVRTVLDRPTTPPEAELVLGEVVTLPGRWSSYPPHHHAQPEIYHYRFDRPEGYGHAELGEHVYKVRHFDTVKIFGVDHAQAAAPGYAMYYSWVIRHLPDRPYTGPEFTAEHRWVMQPGAPFWQPRGGT